SADLVVHLGGPASFFALGAFHHARFALLLPCLAEAEETPTDIAQGFAIPELPPPPPKNLGTHCHSQGSLVEVPLGGFFCAKNVQRARRRGDPSPCPVTVPCWSPLCPLVGHG